MNTTYANLPEGSRMFVKQNLECLQFVILLSFALVDKKNNGNNKIFCWYISNGSFKMKLPKTSPPINISHM